VLLAWGRLDEARSAIERARECFAALGYKIGVAASTSNIGDVCLRQRRFAEALQQFQISLELVREIGTSDGEAIVLENLGTAWLALGDVDRSRRTLEECVRICREIGKREVLIKALVTMAVVVEESGDPARARGMTSEAVALGREAGYGSALVEALNCLGDQLARAGNVDEARAALDEADALCRELELRGPHAFTLALLGRLPGADVQRAISTLDGDGAVADSAQLRHVLWEATGDATHLGRAKRLLDESLANVPDEYHEAIRSNLRVNREIMVAWRQHFGPESDD